ncbi:hypothetical protein NHX12_019274, partial [Muraenolepis orangiensis]
MASLDLTAASVSPGNPWGEGGGGGEGGKGQRSGAEVRGDATTTTIVRRRQIRKPLRKTVLTFDPWSSEEGVCHHSGLSFPHGSHWQEECNGCQCVHGNVLCSKVRCGRRPCLLPNMLSGPEGATNSAPCPAGQECVEHLYLTCFSPPCRQWGVCSEAEAHTAPLGPSPDTRCEPNSGYLDNSCVRITLIFQPDRVPQVSGRSHGNRRGFGGGFEVSGRSYGNRQGVGWWGFEGTTIEKICSELRFLPVTQTLARDRTLRILCDRSYSNEDAVEVAMEAAREVISSLSKRPNSTVMLALVEVKVETSAMTMPVDYLVPVLVSVFGVLWLACIAVCIWWRRRRKKDRREAELAAQDRTVNNQLQPLSGGRGKAHKDNRHKDPLYEGRKEPLGRDKPSNTKRERGIVGNGGGGGGGLICTTRGGPVKGPHRTPYGPNDNRWKNLNATKLRDDIRDHY